MFLKDILFPKVCAGCGLLGMYICRRCQGHLSSLAYDRCFYCRRRSYLGLTHPGCRRPRGVDGFIAAYYYNAALKKIIKIIKYRLVEEALQEFLTIVPPEVFYKVMQLARMSGLLTIVPVPLHPARLRSRGFNQAARIGLCVSDLTKLPYHDLLKRIKETRPQAQLTKKNERYQNLRGAFAIRGQALRYIHILLIDDVSTSGSTLREAATALKKAGAARVFVFTLATT